MTVVLTISMVLGGCLRPTPPQARPNIKSQRGPGHLLTAESAAVSSLKQQIGTGKRTMKNRELSIDRFGSFLCSCDVGRGCWKVEITDDYGSVMCVPCDVTRPSSCAMVSVD